ncbi:multimeric flavodoxin WrbA [Methanolinea mesophila]|uniref:flavodoxin family protein n=1 Tax=Methanolinea mesophila TaxID=547055 RepID=UPI001AE6B250|nr:flavodoxin family protein [Methanolinea mesophila]MBP1929118.1 multimeric flavodoxin WrbA [Methanolinea mesophila]
MKGKVLLLCGSPRPKGNTAQVTEECARVIRDQGLDAEIFSLAGKKVESCTACYRCREEGNCVLEDCVPELIEKLRDADGFIVASPVYFGTARGDVMAALQRIGLVSMSNERFLSWMVGGPIAVARRGGHTATVQEMLMFFLINEMIVPGSNYWNMVFGFAPGEVWNDEEGMETVRVFSRNVARLIGRIGGKG